MKSQDAKALLQRLLPNDRNEISVTLVIRQTSRERLHGLIDLNCDGKCVLEIESYENVIDKAIKNHWGEGEILEATVKLNPSSISLLTDAAIIEDVLMIVPQPQTSLYQYFDGYCEESHGEDFRNFVRILGDPIQEILKDYGLHVVTQIDMKKDPDVPGIDNILFSIVDQSTSSSRIRATVMVDCFAGLLIIDGVRKIRYLGSDQIDTIIIGIVEDYTAPLPKSDIVVSEAAEA